jgi:ferredoxin
MRLVVDLAKCQGYAQCAFLAPEVFRMVGEEALMYYPNPDDAQREHVLRAAAACPVQAILVDYLDLAGRTDEAGGAEPAGTEAEPARTAELAGAPRS